MQPITVSADLARPISVRGDIYYPANWDESINDVAPDDVYHYVVCVRDGDSPASDGSVPLYELVCRPDIDWSNPASLTTVSNPDPYYYRISAPYYDDDCTIPTANAITIDGVEYVLCVTYTSDGPDLTDGILTLTSHAMRANASTVYALTWSGPIDYDKAEVSLYSDRASII